MKEKAVGFDGREQRIVIDSYLFAVAVVAVAVWCHVRTGPAMGMVFLKAGWMSAG